jgi:hypothetical protein
MLTHSTQEHIIGLGLISSTSLKLRKSEVQPDTMTEDFGGKRAAVTGTGISGLSGVSSHIASFAC